MFKDVPSASTFTVVKEIKDGMSGDRKYYIDTVDGQKRLLRIFLLTIEKLGLKAEDCIYIDDRRGNLTAAKRVGMKPILLNSRNVEYEGTSVNDFDELVNVMSALDLRGVTKRKL